MTYRDIENSIHDAQPVLLVYFEYASFQLTYTNDNETVTYNGRDYEPLAFEITDVELTTINGEDRTVDLTFPYDVAFRDDLFNSSLAEEIRVAIYRFHKTDPDNEVVLFYEGFVSNFRQLEEEFEVRLVDRVSALRSRIHNFYYQGICNHLLYDTGCGVDRDSFTIDATVASISDNRFEITINETIDEDDQYYRGGTLGYDDINQRTILSQEGNVFSISADLSDLDISDALFIRAGCDHSLTTCRTKFANSANFGGMAFIPTREIFVDGAE